MSSDPYVPYFGSLPTPEPQRFYADMVYERIQSLIKARTDTLSPNERLNVIVPLLDGGRITVDEFGFQNPSFIVVYGIDSETDGLVDAFIPYTSIQVLVSVIKAEPTEQPRRIIGFRGEI